MSGCSTPSVTHTWTPAGPSSARRSVRQMPVIQPSARQTVRDLMAWDRTCRDRQSECIGWIESNERAQTH